MNAPRPLRFFCVLALFTITQCATSVHNVQPSNGIEDSKTLDKLEVKDKKLEIFDGVYVNIPRENSSRLFSFEVDTNKAEEGRGKKKKLMQRILPMFLIPFIIQSTIIPFFLGLLKFMLLKSLLIGKLALTFIIINAFKNSNSFKGRDAEMASVHYGYHDSGMEYGAYLN